MRIQTQHSRSMAAFRKLMHLLARPVKGNRGGAGVVIQPYRGFGSEEKIFLMGRVFRQPGGSEGIRRGTVARDVVDVGRRILRRGVGRAVLRITFRDTRQIVTADRNGYFKVLMRPAHPLLTDRLWHSVQIELLRPRFSNPKAEGSFFVPPRSARYVVISDIDDTVIYTGVANKAMMMWRMFFQKPASRTAFPGVAAFYRALHRGRSGEEMNPILYVSRGPWAIYEVLDAFFNLHRIPVGPILFLREWGLTLQRPFPPPSRGHKLDLVRSMLSLYAGLSFILIGDSGQHDPEIYAQVVREHPGRILAVYIRNVSRNPDRIRAVEVLARQVAEDGGSLVLAADTVALASHAAGKGLIRPEDLQEVRGERLEEEGSTRQETMDAIGKGEVKEALEEKPSGSRPLNVVIEPKED